MGGIMIVSIIQLMLTGYWIVYSLRSTNKNQREKPGFVVGFTIYRIFITFCLVLSIMLIEISPFNGEKALLPFTLLTFFSLCSFWVTQYQLEKKHGSKPFFITFTGTLFWLSLLTAIKFIPIYGFSWFPLIGFFIPLPMLVAILCLSDLRYASMIDDRFSLLQAITYGFMPIILLNFLLNHFYSENHLFLKLFYPTTQSFF